MNKLTLFVTDSLYEPTDLLKEREMYQILIQIFIVSFKLHISLIALQYTTKILKKPVDFDKVQYVHHAWRPK